MPDPFARKKNPQLKAERGYTDKKSFVRNDGSERLYGLDWIRRRRELYKRAQGQCEYVNMEIVSRCKMDAADPHHIKPRSKGRDDRLSNLQALCRYHHGLLDERKIGGRHAAKV